MKTWVFAILAALAINPLAARADGPAPANSSASFRTDSANPQLPWYRPKRDEFPPIGSEHRVRGQLVEADYIHRTGQFRTEGSGELVSFTLLPYALVYYLNAEADLRDVPLGTSLQFFLYQDDAGAFTRAAVARDDYTVLARESLILRLESVKAGTGKDGQSTLTISHQKPGENAAEHAHEELILDDHTPIWKGADRIKPADLAAGDELLVDMQGSPRCAEVWVGGETQKHATEQQRKKHTAFLKQRGLAARVDSTDRKKLVVTVFGDPAGVAALFKDEGIVPEQWAKEHREVRAAVANEELRTYNPPVDNQGSIIQDFQQVPTDGYGNSGVQWTLEPRLLIEGFRRGHIIRIFAPGWRIEDMPFGETLYTERPGAKAEEESANQYSYRTDFANFDLPWYQLKTGEFPPYQSQHIVSGELLKIDPMHRQGQFRTNGASAIVDFTMPPFGSILYLNAEAELADLPIGRQYSFYLYQDEKGAFTRAAIIMDEFTRLSNEKLTCRVERVNLSEGKLELAYQLATMLDDKDHLIRPPDLGHGEFGIDEATRVWKGDKQVSLGDFVVGDELLVNLSGSTATSRSRCTDIWIGLDTHKLAAAKQHAVHAAFLKENGLPAWIENVEGNSLTLTFFAGNRKAFQDLINGDPNGQSVTVRLVDNDLRPMDDHVELMKYRAPIPEKNTAGTYGSAGVRWIIEAEHVPEGYRKGAVIRVFKPEWLDKSRKN